MTKNQKPQAEAGDEMKGEKKKNLLPPLRGKTLFVDANERKDDGKQDSGSDAEESNKDGEVSDQDDSGSQSGPDTIDYSIVSDDDGHCIIPDAIRSNYEWDPDNKDSTSATKLRSFVSNDQGTKSLCSIL
jgi:hypothetical protein